MSISTQEEARELIAEVRERNGGITAEDRKYLEENRPSVLRALQETRRQLADSIKIVVDNLYSKETRFLYELIQNAEDNSYLGAIKTGEKPFLTFKVYPDKITIDSNEDGFSESNIRAICSVGRSTKKHSAGYIGEKGIGFKSVFKIAHKVHIHSGPFSFAFSHTRDNDDDGLGMITPYYEGAGDLPHGVRTRITLTLLDPTKYEERAAEFRDVPETFLMFLNQLQRLFIGVHEPGSNPMTITYSKQETKRNGLYTTLLTKTTRRGMEESISNQTYYITKSDLCDLPFDEARKDKAGKSIDTATVILAFPVDEHDKPVIKPQYTYAFLPLRPVGFNFLIQADFVTSANREDVVYSKRNRAILDGVAKAFTDTMRLFSKIPSLKYQWMRYLPGDSIYDGFWRSLWDIIREQLEQTPVLEPWSGRGVYKPSDLQRLSASDIAEDGSPLLRDIEGAEIYLSPQYTEADFQILKRLGTRLLGWGEFLDRLDADLRHPNGSKWRLTKNSDWRTRICTTLSVCFNKNYTKQETRLRSLLLIPLSDGRWVDSDPTNHYYFPISDGVSIPVDIGLDLVCSTAMENDAWVDFLCKLGVSNCSHEVVVDSIQKRYDCTTFENFVLSNAVAHMRYLYWFLPEEVSSLAPQLRFANRHGSLTKIDQYLYFPDEIDDYSPTQLFKQDAQLPGHPVNYLHVDYLRAVHPQTTHNGRSWTNWLEQVAGIRRTPEIGAPGHDGLSKEFKYIIDYRSNRLLGTLKRGWACYRDRISRSMKEELQGSTVLLENGQTSLLKNTFLPLPKLKHIIEELNIVDAFPFIAMSQTPRDEERLDWVFLEDFYISIEEDLVFYVYVLEAFKETNPAPTETSSRDRLSRIYKKILLRSSEGLDYIRDMFETPLIWVPITTETDTSWLSSKDCVWDGPQWLQSKQRLRLDPYLELEHFFKVSLKIPDASELDVINDLRMLKSCCEEENARKSQGNDNIPESHTGATSPPFHAHQEKEGTSTLLHYQSISFMSAYQDQSYEEIRLQEYNKGMKFSGPESSIIKSKAFTTLSNENIVKEVEKRYRYLWQENSYSANSEDTKSHSGLRFAFEDFALVYIAREKAWRRPSQCVWVDSSVKIPGKASVADSFPTMKAFFTRDLEISEPTVEMYIQSLRAGAKEKASVTQTKDTMALICRLGIGKTDLSSLLEECFLPVKLASGASRSVAAVSKGKVADFAIVDNIVHWNAFKGKLTTLDFSLEEIRDTRPLLLALGLENLFTSKSVREITDVKGGSHNHEMTRNLRSKSQAFARSAFHFASPSTRLNVTSLYRKFKQGKVHISDGIRRSLQITQRDCTIEGASTRANFHVEEVEGALQLYVPKDEVERDVCFESDLPRKLCTFLGITDPSAPAIIGAIFRKDNAVVIGKILENAGVGEVECDFDALDERLEPDSDEETVVETTSSTRLGTPNPAPYARTPSSSARPRGRQYDFGNADGVHNTATPSPPQLEQQRNPQENAHSRILEQVVNVARQRVKCGVFEFDESLAGNQMQIQALPFEVVREAYPARSQDRDFKVGATGELYMFEYLKGLDLPDFGLKHWKSSIRDRVKSHAEYQDIENCHDRNAIADIEYMDESRKLTRFLTDRGYLAPRFFDSDRPLYHFEVKTTVSSDWQEPFFMSKAQERHIQDKRIEVGKSRTNIYVICRIFNLGQGDRTGLHIYVDPEAKRGNGELEFNTHTWAIKPLIRPSISKEKGVARGFASATPTTSVANVSSEHDEGASSDDKEPKTTDSIPKNSTRRSSSSRPDSHTQTESSSPSPFRFPSAASRSSTENHMFSGGSLFGHPQTPATAGTNLFKSTSLNSNSNISQPPVPGPSSPKPTASDAAVPEGAPKGGLFGSSPSSDTSKTPSSGLFSTTSSSPNTGVPGLPSSGSKSSNSMPQGSLFGQNLTGAKNETSKTSPGKSLFGRSADSGAFGGSLFGSSTGSDFGKGTSGGTSGFDGFGFRSTFENPPWKTQSTGSLFGQGATKPSDEKNAKMDPSTSIFGSSSNTGGLFGAEPPPWGNQGPRPTFGSSSNTGGLFGAEPPPWDNQGPRPKSTGNLFASTSSSEDKLPPGSSFFSGGGRISFGGNKSKSTDAPFSTSESIFGATNNSVFGTPKPNPSASNPVGSAKPTSTPNNLFGSPKQNPPASNLFGSTDATSSTGGSLFGAAKPAPSNTNLFGSPKSNSTTRTPSSISPFDFSNVSGTASASKPKTSPDSRAPTEGSSTSPSPSPKPDSCRQQ